MLKVGIRLPVGHEVLIFIVYVSAVVEILPQLQPGVVKLLECCCTTSYCQRLPDAKSASGMLMWKSANSAFCLIFSVTKMQNSQISGFAFIKHISVRLRINCHRCLVSFPGV